MSQIHLSINGMPGTVNDPTPGPQPGTFVGTFTPALTPTQISQEQAARAGAAALVGQPLQVARFTGSPPTGAPPQSPTSLGVTPRSSLSPLDFVTHMTDRFRQKVGEWETNKKVTPEKAAEARAAVGGLLEGFKKLGSVLSSLRQKTGTGIADAQDKVRDQIKQLGGDAAKHATPFREYQKVRQGLDNARTALTHAKHVGDKASIQKHEHEHDQAKARHDAYVTQLLAKLTAQNAMATPQFSQIRRMTTAILDKLSDGAVTQADEAAQRAATAERLFEVRDRWLNLKGIYSNAVQDVLTRLVKEQYSRALDPSKPVDYDKVVKIKDSILADPAVAKLNLSAIDSKRLAVDLEDLEMIAVGNNPAGVAAQRAAQQAAQGSGVAPPGGAPAPTPAPSPTPLSPAVTPPPIVPFGPIKTVYGATIELNVASRVDRRGIAHEGVYLTMRMGGDPKHTLEIRLAKGSDQATLNACAELLNPGGQPARNPDGSPALDAQGQIVLTRPGKLAAILSENPTKVSHTGQKGDPWKIALSNDSAALKTLLSAGDKISLIGLGAERVNLSGVNLLKLEDVEMRRCILNNVDCVAAHIKDTKIEWCTAHAANFDGAVFEGKKSSLRHSSLMHSHIGAALGFTDMRDTVLLHTVRTGMTHEAFAKSHAQHDPNAQRSGLASLAYFFRHDLGIVSRLIDRAPGVGTQQALLKYWNRSTFDGEPGTGYEAMDGAMKRHATTVTKGTFSRVQESLYRPFHGQELINHLIEIPQVEGSSRAQFLNLKNSDAMMQALGLRKGARGAADALLPTDKNEVKTWLYTDDDDHPGLVALADLRFNAKSQQWETNRNGGFAWLEVKDAARILAARAGNSDATIQKVEPTTPVDLRAVGKF